MLSLFNHRIMDALLRATKQSLDVYKKHLFYTRSLDQSQATKQAIIQVYGYVTLYVVTVRSSATRNPKHKPKWQIFPSECRVKMRVKLDMLMVRLTWCWRFQTLWYGQPWRRSKASSTRPYTRCSKWVVVWHRYISPVAGESSGDVYMAAASVRRVCSGAKNGTETQISSAASLGQDRPDQCPCQSRPSTRNPFFCLHRRWETTTKAYPSTRTSRSWSWCWHPVSTHSENR